jgi:hypothetical protein
MTRPPPHSGRSPHPSLPEVVLAVGSSPAPRGPRRSAPRACLGSLALALTASPAGALEPRSSTEPDVLSETADVTRVVDAWGERGGMDLHFTLGYQRTWKRATLLRETQSPAIDARADGGTLQVPVARFSENTSRLNLRADLGLWRNLALIVKLPIVLSTSTTLEACGVGAAALDATPGVPLFSLPFGSPNRSGVEYLGVGVDWGVLDQSLDADLPSVLVGAEARFSVSEPMHACGPAPLAEGQTDATTRCTYPADINRNNVDGEYPVELASGRIDSLEGKFPTERRRGGVSRGTTALDLHAAVSRRFGQMEPYLTFGVLFELPDAGSDFGRDREWKTGPPAQGRVSVGAEFMPWELVEQYQRLSIDVRLAGTYRSEGEDYSELFDALGSSGAPSYRQPSFAGYIENPDASNRAAVPSVLDASSERVFPTGLTRVGAHGSYALRLAARWQAGEYVHFDVGGALAFTEKHFITLGQPCDAGRVVARQTAGPCAGPDGGAPVGAPNPSYRPETDQPGQRFVVGTARSVDAWVGATVMF